MYEEVKRCRACGDERLEPILDLGQQRLSGVFPHPDSPQPASSPLTLVRCGAERCRLVQLRHSASVAEMYGKTYGYHSSLSPTMTAHLRDKVEKVLEFVKPSKGEIILDIGCNDGTLLNCCRAWNLQRVGIDPSSKKFASSFDPDIDVIFDFFSADAVRTVIGSRQCRIITSIAMFYDIEDPVGFMKQIRSLLAPNGVWVLELSYLPLLMTRLTYDQICHEHLTYLSLRDMAHMAARAGLRIIDVELNEVNGGSFHLVIAREDGPYPPNTSRIEQLLQEEAPLTGRGPFERLKTRVEHHRHEVRHLLRVLREARHSVAGYGASTKGNIVLNYCGLTAEDLPYISDRNPEKDGLVTPGSSIPIVSHEEMRRRAPEYLIAFIWHLRREILTDERSFLERGGRIVFLLPRIHVVDRENCESYLKQGFEELAFGL